MSDRAFFRMKLPPYLSVFLYIQALGALAGVIWYLVAPTVKVAGVLPEYSGPRGAVYIDSPLEGQHRFLAVVLFMVIALIVGILSGIGGWLLFPKMHGPLLVIVVLIASASAMWVAILVGNDIFSLRYPLPEGIFRGQTAQVGPVITEYVTRLAICGTSAMFAGFTCTGAALYAMTKTNREVSYPVSPSTISGSPVPGGPVPGATHESRDSESTFSGNMTPPKD